MRKLPDEPLTLQVLRVLFRAKAPLTRAELMRRVGVHPATEITRPLRDLRKPHTRWAILLAKLAGALHPRKPDCKPCAGALHVPCTKDAAGRPAYWLTEMDRACAAVILGVQP